MVIIDTIGVCVDPDFACEFEDYLNINASKHTVEIKKIICGSKDKANNRLKVSVETIALGGSG